MEFLGIVILIIAGVTGCVVVCASLIEGPRPASVAAIGLVLGFALQLGVNLLSMKVAPLHRLFYPLALSLALAVAYSYRGRSIAATAAVVVIALPIMLELALYENQAWHRRLVMPILAAYVLKPVIVSLLFRDAWRIHSGASR